MTFDWGDVVRVTSDAPLDYRPGSKAWIVGMRTAGEGAASQPVSSERHTLYTIEFEDGSSVEVPGVLLLNISESEKGRSGG